VFWKGESIKLLQEQPDRVEALVLLQRGHVKMKLPPVVFSFFQSNAQAMMLGGNGMALAILLNELEALTGFDPEKIVRSEWWKDLRLALWVIKVG
jgi:hypothetical protein